MLIALTGYLQSGKDAVADVLVKEFGFKKLGFADPLYDFALMLNPLVMTTVRRIRRSRRLKEFVEECGDWRIAKEQPEIRKFLQDLGEGGRQFAYPAIWTDVLVNKVKKHDGDIVVTNVRHPNEWDILKQFNSILIRVDRPGKGPSDHITEQGLCFPFAQDAIVNDLGLEELAQKVREKYPYWRKERAQILRRW